MKGEEGLLDRIGKAFRRLDSPESLVAFVAWWMVLALVTTDLSSLFVLLLAAWLGAVTGVAIQVTKKRLEAPKQTVGVLNEIDLLRNNVVSPSTDKGISLRMRLDVLEIRLRSGNTSIEECKDELSEIQDEILQELSAVEVRAGSRSSSTRETEKALGTGRLDGILKEIEAKASETTTKSSELDGLERLYEVTDD